MSKEQVDILAILETCEQLIAKGKTKEALAQLIDLPDSKTRAKFVGLSNQFNTLDRDFKSGILTHEEMASKLARVNGAILADIQRLKTGKSQIEKSSGKMLLGLSLGVLLLLMGYWLLKPGPQGIAKTMDCPPERKTAVYVAQFQQDKVDGFSTSVAGELRNELEKEKYTVGGVDFQTLNNPNYYDSIRVKYFEQSCDTSGLFLSGLWDKVDQVFNCYINLFHLSVKIPGLQDQPSIILNNPPGITFSVKEDVQFLTDFVVGILKTYEGEAYEALKLFTKLEKDAILLQDDEVKAYVAHYKGNCYAMRGNQAQAQVNYEKAATLAPNLRRLALANRQMAANIFQLMSNDPKLKPILLHNLSQDSLMDASGPVTSPIDVLAADDGSEVGQIELVAEQLKVKILDGKQKEETLVEKGLSSVEKEEASDAKDTTTLDEKNKQSIASTQGGKHVDPRDNKSYPTIIIDGKTWLAENLNYKIGKSWCYNYKEANCTQYGRLYDWESAIEACKSLGAGWRLPSDKEWREMTKLFGGSDDDARDGGKAASDALITGGSTGFQATLGGWRRSSGSYGGRGSLGYYWSSADVDAGLSVLYNFFNGKLRRSRSFKSNGLSCRCIKD